MNVSKVAKQGLLYTQTGTPYYASPEVWRDQPYDLKSDIWSLGCVLYEAVSLKPPFRADDMAGLYKKVTKGVYPRIPAQYSKDLENTIRLLLNVVPQNRPTCEQILAMPSVIRMGQKTFGEGYKTFSRQREHEQQDMLKTIRIPKSLMYLTDRLPKANYDDESSLMIPLPSKISQQKKTLERHRSNNDFRT
jgi:NIMA (never in mitosis gene a)-related kinase 1/4/5